MKCYQLDARLERSLQLVLACALAIATCVTAAAQDPVPPPVPPSRPEIAPRSVPVPVLYRAFFGHVEFLDREAGKLEERGENCATGLMGNRLDRTDR